MSYKEINILVPTEVYALLENEAKRQNSDLPKMVYEIIKSYLDKRSLEENINKTVFSME